MTAGAMNILGSFGARLGLDTTDYTRGILNANGLNQIFGQNVATFIANPLLGTASILTDLAGNVVNAASSFISASVSTGQEVLANAERIQRLSDQTGIAVEVIQALEQRMDVAAGAGDRVGEAMVAFARRVDRARRSTGAAAASVRQFGIDLGQTGDSTESLRLVLDYLNSVEDPARRAAIASDLFGDRVGPKLVDAVGGGRDAMARMVEEATALGRVLDRQSTEQLAHFNTTLGVTQQAMEGLFPFLVAQFLVGFTSQFETSEQSVVRSSAAITEKLGPAARNLGDAAGSIAGDTERIADAIERISLLFDPIIEKTEALKEVAMVFDRFPQAKEAFVKAIPSALADTLVSPITGNTAIESLQEFGLPSERAFGGYGVLR
ncbi:MAG: hypothetical protein AAF747_10990 [Planctomycetota bacterium]